MNDLIDRQAALDIFKPWLDVKGYSEGELNMLRAVIYELETMPSISAWVSVKDKLPERKGNYLTVYQCKHSGGIFVGTDWFLPECGYFCKEAPWNNTQTLYWMTLPEPPESE